MAKKSKKADGKPGVPMVQFLKIEGGDVTVRCDPMPGTETFRLGEEDGTDGAEYAVVPAGLEGKALWDHLRDAAGPQRRAEMLRHEKEVIEDRDEDPLWKRW